ncbi:MAG: hypothetical protein LBG73_05895 [Spirochaetaceae bacterium]|nr:hypothetical protein [Spirochaetaceae bacterium]
MNHAEFLDQYEKIGKKALFLANKAFREGLPAIEEELEDATKFDDRDIFEYGIRFVIDECDGKIIEKILSNIIDQEQDVRAKVLKTIQKEAVLRIQEGMSPLTLRYLLNSYTGLSLKEDTVFIWSIQEGFDLFFS